MIRQGLDFAYVMQLTFGQVWEREGMYGGSFAKILIYKKNVYLIKPQLQMGLMFSFVESTQDNKNYIQE